MLISRILMNIRILLKNKFFILVLFVIIISSAYWGIDIVMNNFDGEESFVIEEDEREKLEKDSESVNEYDEIKEESKDIMDQQENVNEVEKEFEREIEESIEDIENEINEDINNIHIYITGEVNNPGVVVIEEGSRIIDAINAAGGTTSKANISKINLVYVLDDGMKVNIPNDKDLKDNPNFKYVTSGSGDDVDDYKVIVDEESGSFDNISKEDKEKYDSSINIVNINYATQTELETLPGIGPSLALKIINYRKENGLFAAIEDIKNVSGIGDSKFEDIKKYIKI